ncbi:MAG: heterodisulfide reductase-related iron-sulfur binding cluster [Desulfosoma sp.]
MIVVQIGRLAEQLGVHRNTIRNWIRSGRLPARRVPGKRYLVDEEEFLKLCHAYGLDASALQVRQVSSPSTLPFDPMEDEEGAVQLGSCAGTLRSWIPGIDVCLSCGSCVGVCPIAGVDGSDPRKMVRMAVLGMERELGESLWPWKCTLCAKCEQVCPAGVDITGFMMAVRRAWDRDRIPGALHKGVLTSLETGNNLGIPREDFIACCEAVARELAETECPGFRLPLDLKGARLLVTVNSKEPFAEPWQMRHWWKIFYAAEESWTLTSEHWDGVQWGIFTGDDEAVRVSVGRVVDNMRRLGCEALLLPECGHAYYAFRMALQRWYADETKRFRVLTLFDLLLDYLQTGRIHVRSDCFPGVVTYHDPCHFTRKSLKFFGQAYDEQARDILRRCCGELVEMMPNREDAFCCGAGGGLSVLPFHEERVFFGRYKARQIRRTGAHLVVTSCHTCRDQILKSLCKEYDLSVNVKLLWELVADALVLSQSSNGEVRS